MVVKTPLRLGLGKDSTLAGAGVQARAGPVPEPVADVLLPVQNAGDRAGGPPLARANATGDELLVKKPGNRRSGLTVGVGLEDADDDGSLIGIDADLEPLGAGAALGVAANGPGGKGPIAERGFGEEEAAALLTQLTAQSLGLQITDIGLVEDAAELNHQRGVRIRGVEAVGDGDDPDALQLEVHHHAEGEEGVAGQPREVVDQDDVEGMVASSGAKTIECGPAPADA